MWSTAWKCGASGIGALQAQSNAPYYEVAEINVIDQPSYEVQFDCVPPMTILAAAVVLSWERCA